MVERIKIVVRHLPDAARFAVLLLRRQAWRGQRLNRFPPRNLALPCPEKVSPASVRFAAALCALGIAALPAYAQEYPYQSIRIIDGFAPGGATDFLARSIGPS